MIMEPSRREFLGTLAAFSTGIALLLTAPWLTRGVTAGDRWLIRGLLGPVQLAERVRESP